MIGESPNIIAVRRAIQQVATTDATVLILGESGTGKELVARLIHQQSQRNAKAFVAVSGVALAPELITSELFGHEAGAFTGATRKRIGKFEQAHAGTLFLDEIGELSTDAQALLLRVLQERVIERVGGDVVPVDFRLLAATNRELLSEVKSSRFRQDLFYRLNVFQITVPALRERQFDIPMLVEHFVQHFSKKHGKADLSITPATMRVFTSYSWPGNVRELQNIIERAVIVSEEKVLAFDASWLVGASVVETAKTWTAQEKQRLLDALQSSGGRIYGPGGAAHRLGLNPTTLYGKMRKHGISKDGTQWR
ncbi:MAG: sigma-54 dependent transcriptional regulator [Gemmatales bacterium]